MKQSHTKENEIDLVNNYSQRSRIQNIYIGLDDYSFNHHPLSGDQEEEKDKYTGRSAIEKKILNILKFGKDNGAYLVTGYRGMGKTSFVKKAINEYREECKEKVIEINLSLAQTKLSEEDILKQIIQSLISKGEENRWIKAANLFTRGSLLKLFLLFSTLSLILMFFFLWEGIDGKTPYKLIITFDRQTILKDIGKVFTSKITGFPSLLNILIFCSALAVTATYFILFIRRIAIIIFEIIDYSKEFRKKITKKRLIAFLKKNSSYLITIPLLSLYSYFVIYKKTIASSPYIDIPVLAILFSILFVISYVYVNERIVKEYEIIKELKKLLNRCNASITEETGIEGTIEKIPIGFVQKSTKQFPIASPKEVEYEIIRILLLYQKLTYYGKKFIFVFDELDKVEPQFNRNKVYGQGNDDNYGVEIHELRDRKKTIISILSSLKHFITEAKARFIFIGGREMFDASLADIADRQSFISSIFHQIIYVDSFLKDNPPHSSRGLTNLIEVYLEKLLIVNHEEKATRSNKDRHSESSFLKKFYDQLSQTETITESKLKVLFTLQNFIIYLTYRSNGSPKKMVKIFEDHIVSTSTCDKVDKNNNIILNTNRKTSHYLKFNLYDQYRFGFISYLYRPFILSLSQHVKKYSDNVLVATPYLMDHIIKFHPFAFSMQNLELLPEVISSNRHPIVRTFIEDLIDYLRNNHLGETEMGLFDYKFFNKTANEINFISKIFEEESAAFNFSLDEMYSIKLYLKNRINELRNNYRDFTSTEGTPLTIYSISFLNSVLGDAHYFDQEFDNAIVSYLDGLQIMRIAGIKEKENSEWIMSDLRLKLKLGLVYEKIKKYDMASTYYNDAIRSILDHLKDTIIVQNDQVKAGKQKTLPAPILNSLQLVFQSFMAEIHVQEKKNMNGVSQKLIEKYTAVVTNLTKSETNTPIKNLPVSDFHNDIGTLYFYKNHFHPLPPSKHSSYSSFIFELVKRRKSEIMQLSYPQRSVNNKDYRFPVLALIKYKDALENLQSENDGKNTDGEKTILNLCANFAEKIHIYKNIYDTNHLKMIGQTLSKIGDLLFSTFLYNESNEQPKPLETISKIWVSRAQIKDDMEKNHKSLKIKSSTDTVNHNFDHCRKWYLKKECAKITSFLDSPDPSESAILEIRKILEYESYRPMSFWDQAAHEFFNPESDHKQHNELELIIFIYYLAGRYYSKAGKNVSFSFQLRKIFQILRNSLKCGIKEDTYNTNLITFLEESLLKLILEITSWNSISTDRPQMYKYKHYENLEKINDGNQIYHPRGFARHNYSNISNNPESKEAILLHADLKIFLNNVKFEFQNPENDPSRKVTTEEINRELNKIQELSLINPFSSISSQFTRLQELNLQDKINRIFLKKIPGKYELIKWSDNDFKLYKKNEIDKIGDYKILRNDPELTAFLRELTANSIFNLLQIINIIKIYTVNPYLSYSYLANFHRRLGEWLKYYHLFRFLEIKDNEEKTSRKSWENLKIDELIKNLFHHSEALITLDATSQFQISLQLYHKAKEAHSNGISYQNEFKKQIYLEGDFDDNLYHFGVALERQKINSGKVRDKIKELELELSSSPLYKFTSFANFDKL